MSDTLIPSKLGGWWHWCPGCAMEHRIPERWTFNGNTAAPTFDPSVRHTWSYGAADRPRKECHYFVRNGRIEFCGDSTHALAGQTVALPAADTWRHELVDDA